MARLAANNHFHIAVGLPRSRCGRSQKPECEVAFDRRADLNLRRRFHGLAVQKGLLDE